MLNKNYLFVILSIILFFSCNNDNKLKVYKKYHNKKDWYYKNLNNGLTKWIKFFPETKKVSDIYFINEKGEYDSISYHFFLNGKIEYKAEYKNNKEIFCKFYYKNGTLKKEYIIKNKYIQGEVKQYYKNGNIESISETVLLDDSIELNNNIRKYKKSGNLDINNTIFAELITKKDTISINDSLEVGIKVIIPNSYKWLAYYGFINDGYFGEVDYNKVKLIKNTFFYFRPNQIGINKIGVVIEINITPNKNHAKVIKRFVEKQVYVTKKIHK